MELDNDSKIMNSIKQHFLHLKKSCQNSNSRLTFSKEILLLLRFAQESSNPKELLKKIGIVLFHDMCAFNLSILTNYLIKSRSQINRLLNGEKWEHIKINLQLQKQHIRHVIPENEFKNWTLRKFPAKCGVLDFAEANRIIQYKDSTFPVEIEADFPSLSLQMDVISFTFDYQ